MRNAGARSFSRLSLGTNLALTSIVKVRIAPLQPPSLVGTNVPMIAMLISLALSELLLLLIPCLPAGSPGCRRRVASAVLSDLGKAAVSRQEAVDHVRDELCHLLVLAIGLTVSGGIGLQRGIRLGLQ